MQISRRVLLACAASLAFSTYFSTPLAAQDSDAQLRARKALDQRIQEMNQNPPAPVTPVTPAPRSAPAEKPPAQPKPVAQVTKTNPPPAPAAAVVVVHESKTTPPSEPQFMPLPDSTSPQSAEKLQEALRRKEMEMDAQKAASSSAPVKAAPASTSANAKPVQPSNAQSQAAKEKEKAAAQKAAAEEAKAKQKEAQKGKVAAAPALEPLPAPPTGLSGSKEERLGQLLQQYRADKISPDEYHAQRAKIMAEP